MDEHLKDTLQRVALFIGGILFSFLIAEGIFRVCIHFDIIRYPNQAVLSNMLHQYSKIKGLIYELKPSSSAEYDGLWYKTNQHGMRSRECSLIKPPGVKRICVLGDSVAFGYRLPYMEQTFAYLLEDKLNSNKFKTSRYEVLNFGVTSYNAYQEELTLKKKVIGFSADLVLAGVTPNDDYYSEGDNALCREMSPFSLGSRLHSKLVSYLLNSLDLWLHHKHRNKDKIDHYFAQLALLSKEKHFKVLIVAIPYYFDDLNTYVEKQMHDYYHVISEKYGFNLIDFMELFQGLDLRERKTLFLSDDTYHLSPDGMKKVAEELFEYFLVNPI